MPLPDAVKALFDTKDEAVKKVLTELVPKVEEAFDAVESDFISKKSKLNAEAAGLRKHKIALERIARENGREKVEDPDSFAEEFLTKVKGTTEKAGSIEQQLKLIQQELTAQKEATAAAHKKGREAGVKAKASADFAKLLFSPSLHLNAAISDGLTLADDGETLIWKEGDDIIDYQKGLAAYVAKNKDGAKNLQQPGAGSTGKKKVSGSAKQESTLTQAEFDAMTQIERAKYAKTNPGWSIVG